MRTFLVRLVWLALVALIALGGAGIVASMDHVPSGAGRPELTWTADRAAGPALDAATDQLDGLSGVVDTLGTTARLALAQVVAGSLDPLQQTIAAGTIQLGAGQVAGGSARGQPAAWCRAWARAGSCACPPM